MSLENVDRFRRSVEAWNTRDGEAFIAAREALVDEDVEVFAPDPD